MDLDAGTQLAAVERSVSSTERDGRPAHAITLARAFATTVEDLWDAVTSEERIARWFVPVSGQLEAGGHYQLEGNAGGAITACTPGSGFSVTWEFGGEVSWVDIEMSGDGEGRARLALTHTSGPSETWDEFGPGATGVGWEMGLLALATHVERPGEQLPDEEAFAASAEGRALVAGSAEAWGQAAIDAGDDPASARAAATRTAAVYTGEPIEPA